MPKPVQAAETFVRRETNILDRDAFELVSREKLENGRMQVRLRDTSGTIHDVTIERSDSADAALLTCTATTAAKAVQFRLVDYQRI